MDFRRMRYLINRLPMAQFRVRKAISRATRITPLLSDMPKGGGGQDSRVETGYLLIEAAKAALDSIMGELAGMRGELSPYISRIENPLESMSMQMRYIEGRSVREIAYSLNYSEPHIFRTISKGERDVLEMMKK